MLTGIIAFFILVSSMGGTSTPEHNINVRTMEVIQLDYEADLVTCVDSVGFEWQFYGCEDFYEHDLVSCLMDTMGTEDTILDDVIFDVYYTGYWVE